MDHGKNYKKSGYSMFSISGIDHVSPIFTVILRDTNFNSFSHVGPLVAYWVAMQRHDKFQFMSDVNAVCM